MKLKRTTITLICIVLPILAIACGCSKNVAEVSDQPSAAQKQPLQGAETITFTDAKGRQVTVKKNGARVGIATGSFADCYILAGGTPAAVTRDAYEERQLKLPEDVIDLGSLESPSAEAILTADLDLLILNATLKGHAALAETLDTAGINYAYVDIETFDDYLNTLKTFTDITGNADLYEQNGIQISDKIDQIINANKQDDAPKVLILRASASKITARDSETMVGQMLKNLGAVNIADSDKSLLKELSLEAAAKENPEYIFIICRGDVDEAKAKVDNLLMQNPIWGTLSAVKDGKVFYLEKELFHYKPNARWAESYEALADIFNQD